MFFFFMGVGWGSKETFNVRERPLTTSHIRVGRGSKIAPKKGRYRVGQSSWVGQKWPKNVGRH